MATVGPTNIPAFFNTDADFRTWGSTISAALATLGLIQTADTGQINWTTVVKPAGINTAQGYEIWRFNDSLQAGTPVFIKLEYGSASAVDRPSLWITIGSNSNGSGTLTGQTSTRTQANASASKSNGVTLPFYASGNSGELLLAVNIDTGGTTFGLGVFVERPKDSSDTPTSVGALVSTATSTAAVSSQFVPASGTTPASVTNYCVVNPGIWSRSSAGSSAEACPVFIPVTGNWYFSHLLVTGVGDFTAGGTLTATILGGSHTYMAFDKAAWGGAFVGNSQTAGLAMRWE